MRMRRRIEMAGRRLGLGISLTFPIVWRGHDDERLRKRVEEAMAGGHRVHVIQIGGTGVAETVEEAEARILQHRERHGDHVPITIRRAGSEEVLAEWDPGLPDWLAEAAAQGPR